MWYLFQIAVCVVVTFLVVPEVDHGVLSKHDAKIIVVFAMFAATWLAVATTSCFSRWRSGGGFFPPMHEPSPSAWALKLAAEMEPPPRPMPPRMRAIGDWRSDF